MRLDRRTFLRGTGVAMALPLLDAMKLPARAAGTPTKRRMVCINTPLGMHPAAFFPTATGKDYELSEYLEVVKEFRDQLMETFSAAPVIAKLMGAFVILELPTSLQPVAPRPEWCARAGGGTAATGHHALRAPGAR